MAGELTELHALSPGHFQADRNQALLTCLPEVDKEYFHPFVLHWNMVHKPFLNYFWFCDLTWFAVGIETLRRL